MPQLDFGPQLSELYQLVLVFLFTFFIFFKFYLPNTLLILKSRQKFLTIFDLNLLNSINDNFINLNQKLTKNVIDLKKIDLSNLYLNLLNNLTKKLFLNLNINSNLNLLNNLNSKIIFELEKLL